MMATLLDETTGTLSGLNWGSAGSVAGVMLIAFAQSGAAQLLRTTHEPYSIVQNEGTGIGIHIEENAAVAVLSTLQQVHASLVENGYELPLEEKRLLFENLWELYE